MGRLIEVSDICALGSPLNVKAGDVLLFHTSGARVVSGGEAVEVLGPFTAGLVATHGQVLSPEGPPGTILIRARKHGQATIVVFEGDPFHAPRGVEIVIAVEA